MTPITQIRYEVWNMTYLKFHDKIENPRVLSCELGKFNGFLHKLGEDGRLGKGGHMANLEPTPKFELDWVFGWVGNLKRLSIFMKYSDKPREYIFIIW